MSIDLVERLRAPREMNMDVWRLCSEAAEEIKKLQAENERLRAALLHVRGYIDGMTGMWSLEPGVKMIDDALAPPPQR